MGRARRVVGAVVLTSLVLLVAQVLVSGDRARVADEVLPTLAVPTSPMPPSGPTPEATPTTSTDSSAGGQPSTDPSSAPTARSGPAKPPTPPTRPEAPPGMVPLIRNGAPAPTIGAGGAPAVLASVQTEPFPKVEAGDWADDSAIWRNPTRPERSFVVADNKSEAGGVAVFDLKGQLVHYVQVGKIGNIDLRSNVRVGSRSVTLVGANDRSNGTMRFWALDPVRGTLGSLDNGSLATLTNNYGFCLGRTADGSRTYAFVSDESDGTVEQYALTFTTGRVAATKVRTLHIGSLTEGCAVDDAGGAVYFGEEDVAVWRYALDPATGPTRTAIDRVGTGHLAADVEGIAVARGAHGRGVLVVSSQGNSTYAVYGLDGRHEFMGSFSVGDGPSVDGAQDTDGLDVVAGDFGPAYPDGLLVVHDASPKGAACSNLKFVRFDQVFAF